MDFGRRVYQLPLLPFEKHLIELIGCSEDEYRRFAEEVARKGVIRPAEYDHIPDIRCDPVVTPILISLAVGIATSALSYLLTPKPKEPGRTSQQQLGDIAGQNRFSPTFGFDTQAELANYGDPIPLIFGRYTGETGGMLVSPKLVWSRMFSYGTQQGAKLLFVVGEQGLSADQNPQGIEGPNLDGIFLGNTPLDAVFKNQFAFYWRRNTTISNTGRVRAFSFAYGSRGTPDSGDPEVNDDIFSCPTGVGESDKGFSSARTPSNNQTFGCYAAIPNGTGYRVNWRVVSMPRPKSDGKLAGLGTVDPKLSLSDERVKIAGYLPGVDIPDTDFQVYRTKVFESGMSGVGRAWSRRMGLMALDGLKISEAEGNRIVNAAVGSIGVFKISKTQLPEPFFGEPGGVKVSDINSALNEERIAADDALQIGELFMIGRTLWKVTGRSISQWRPEDEKSQFVTLECVEILGSPRVGVVAETALDRPYLWDDTPNQFAMGVAYFPLQKAAVGLVRNNRVCEVTEIGIKSRVYQRLSGLCNFQVIPSPKQLVDFDNDAVSIGTGVNNSFIRRASGFTIYVRPSGFQAGTNQVYAWQPIGENFVIVGNQPIDQYNFLRIKHPSAGQWEFRFIPKNGADIGANDGEATTYWQLNANASISNSGERSILSSNYSTAYGTFTISGVGQLVAKSAIRGNAEFLQSPTVTTIGSTQGGAEQVAFNKFLPEDDSGSQAISGSYVDSPVNYVVNPSNATEGYIGAFASELFGRADTSGVPINSTKEVIIRHDLTSTRWVKIRYVAQRRALVAGHWSGNNSFWLIQSRSVYGSSTNWKGVNFFVPTVQIADNNPFRNPPGSGPLISVGEVHTVTSRIDGPIGIRQGFFEQVHGPARDFAVGASRTSPVTFSEGGKTIRLLLTSVVESTSGQPSGETKIWSSPTVAIDLGNTTLNWQQGDTFTVPYTVSATNPFRVTGTTVAAEFLVNSLQLSPIEQIFTAARTFEAQSQIADVSFYGSLVEKSNANDAEHSIVYVNELVSNASEPNYDRMTVCGLALKSSRNFTSLEQLRVWLATGIPVTRFHPDDGGNLPLESNERKGPSNLFCDLVYYLLTDRIAGLGVALGISATDPQLVDTAKLTLTAKFLKANKLFFDGAITAPSNFRNFVAEIAPLFLCNFVVSDGKFSLMPAVPTTASGAISSGPVEIKQLFTAGNILENSFELDFAAAEERKPFKAVMRYRSEQRNQLPEEKTLVVRWADEDEYTPIESFDMTQFCTSIQHAELIGRFLLSVRRRVTHSITFKTLPFGVSLAPGDYIRVITEASPYNAARNGSIGPNGEITSATPLADGRYNIVYYKLGEEDIREGAMTVNGGIASETALYSSIFTVLEATVSQNVYMVEQLTLEEDGTVRISASEFPCDDSLGSLLAQDLLPAYRDRFAFEG